MNRVLLFILATAIFSGCSKQSENIIWEKSFGTGNALFVNNVGDTALIAGGQLEGKQYLLFINSDKNTIFDYNPGNTGILTRVWAGSDYIITAGVSDKKLFLSGLDLSGTETWDSAFTASFPVDHASLCNLGNGSFLAIGSGNPDSTYTGLTGLSFVWFNSDGVVSKKTDIENTSFSAVMDAATDIDGYIYLALTKSGAGNSRKATVAKYTPYLTKQWEKDISNNPSFNAACLALILDDNRNPVLAGKTELQISTGKEYNTFVARYMFAIPDDSLNRTYLEFANEGTAITRNSSGDFIVLNSRCNVINIIDQDIKATGTIRTYRSCDSKATDIFGYWITTDSEGNLVIAGTKGGSFYLAVKSSEALSSV